MLLFLLFLVHYLIGLCNKVEYLIVLLGDFYDISYTCTEFKWIGTCVVDADYIILDLIDKSFGIRN